MVEIQTTLLCLIQKTMCHFVVYSAFLIYIGCKKRHTVPLWKLLKFNEYSFEVSFGRVAIWVWGLWVLESSTCPLQREFYNVINDISVAIYIYMTCLINYPIHLRLKNFCSVRFLILISKYIIVWFYEFYSCFYCYEVEM